MRISVLSVLLSFFLLSARAQMNLPNTLLWRINARNGGKPSYLYGTMHLTDDRLFNLSDSLYEAIRVSEGFAAELDVSQMSSMMLSDERTWSDNKLLKDILSPKDLAKYGPLLSKKLHISQDKINTGDIRRAKDQWEMELLRKGKMQTFLDAYLFDLARRQDKWTGGVEDFEDQSSLVDNTIGKKDIVELLDENKDANQTEVEKMIAVYTSQDLEALNEMENEGRPDSTMTKRNRKMSARMDSLSQVRSMVFAVGAAHLPGRLGVINLLRERGFTVEPVMLSKRIQAADYHVTEVPRTWKTVTDEHGYYSVEMPGEPTDRKDFGGSVDMKMYFDIFFMRGFMAMAVRSFREVTNRDSLFDGIAASILKDSSKRSYKPLKLDSISGRVYTASDGDGYKKMYLLEKGGIFYVMMGLAMKEDTASVAEVNRFLASVTIHTVTPASSAGLVPFVDSSLGFRLVTPGVASSYELPIGKIKVTDKKTRFWMASDPVGGAYYLFGATSVSPGFVVTNDSIYLRSSMNGSKTKMNSTDKDTMWVDGVHWMGELRGPANGGQTYAISRLIMRGNRMYNMVVSFPINHAGKQGYPADEFFRSFSLLDYRSGKWSRVVSPDKFLSVWSPGPMRVSPGDTSVDRSVERKFSTHDTIAVVDYSILEYHLHPWFWSGSDSAFWAGRLQLQLGKGDSLLYQKRVNNGGVPGIEWALRKPGSQVCERRRLLLYGDKLYLMMATSLPSEVMSANADRFFEEMRFASEAPSTHIYQSKAAILLDAVFSRDSAAAREAQAFLPEAPWTKADLPVLHAALLRIDSVMPLVIGKYRPLDAILIKVVHLNDSSSWDWAAAQYADTAHHGSQSDMMTIMATGKTLSNYRRLAGLLRKAPPINGLGFQVTDLMKDSLLLLAQVMPDLLPLLKDSLSALYIVNMSKVLTDSGSMNIRTLDPYLDDIFRIADQRTDPRIGQSDYTENDTRLVGLLGLLNLPKANSYLKKFQATQHPYIRTTAIGVLLKNGQVVDTAVIRKLAMNRASRRYLYEKLEDAGRIRLIPAVYRSQQLLAESLIYERWTENYSVGSMLYAGEKVEGGKRYFFYKIKEESDKDYYLGVAGPFDADGSKVSVRNVWGVMNYHAILASDLPKMREELIKSLE